MKEKNSETISLKINLTLLTRLDGAAREVGRDRSSFIREAIEEKLNTMNRPVYKEPPIMDPYYGQYREFDIGGQRVAVSITPLRNAPCVVFHKLDDALMTFTTKDYENNKDHPVVAAYINLHKVTSTYHWDTAAFRDFCQTVGLNPDTLRPTFIAPYQEFAEKMLILTSERWHSLGNRSHYKLYIHDVLDLLRTENASSNTREKLLARCCRDFVEWEDQPEAAEIKAVLIDMGGDL